MNSSRLLNFVYHTTFASILVYALLNACYGTTGVQHICISLLQFYVILVIFVILVVVAIIIMIKFSFQVCRRAGDPTKLMYWKRCDTAYHCYCQQPPHKVVVSFILIFLFLSSHLIMLLYFTEQ